MSITIDQWHDDQHSFESLAKLVQDANPPPETLPIDPPVGGLDIRCGPTLRFIGCLENGTKNYRGSIMIVTKDENTTVEPTVSYTIGPIIPDSLEELKDGVFPGKRFATKAGYSFWRYSIELELTDKEQKVRYSVNGSTGAVKTFEFFLPMAHQPMNIVSHSCNGFSLSTVTEDFKGSLWLDVIRHHYQENRYHVMLGGGDQVYCDAIKNSSEEFQKWLTEKNPIKKRKAKLNQAVSDSFHDFYLNQYLKWYGKGFWKGTAGFTLQSLFPFAMACIPSINIYDDHDIIDGFGSYRDSTMRNEIFSGVGNVAYEYYFLFQHQLALNEEEYEKDRSWILGKTPGPYIKQKSHSIFARLGQGIGFLGLDCRTERKLKQIVPEDTYNLVFQRLQSEISKDPNLKHLLVLLGVPIAYPRLVWLETLLSSRILYPIRKLAQKGIIAKGLVNEFDGSVEVLDDLNDHWCSHNHKAERNKLVSRLQELGAFNGVRITILSGDVHLAAIGRFHSKLHTHHFLEKEKYESMNESVKHEPENDPRLMFNIISSAIVNTPPPNAMATMLNKRSGIHHFDHSTDEDMVPVFLTDVDDKLRGNKEFLNRRNWADIISIKNSQSGYNVGDLRLPGPVGQEEKVEHDADIRDNREMKYTVTNDCIIGRIHVEKDSQSLESLSKAYEIIVPELVGKHKLENIGIKN